MSLKRRLKNLWTLSEGKWLINGEEVKESRGLVEPLEKSHVEKAIIIKRNKVDPIDEIVNGK